MMATERAKIYPENFNLNFSKSTNDSSFNEFKEHEIAFRQILTYFRILVRRIKISKSEFRQGLQ